jgi:hypothetical protein
MDSLLAYRVPAAYRIGKYHPFSFGNAMANWSVASDRIHHESIINKHKRGSAFQQQLARHLQKSCNCRCGVKSTALEKSFIPTRIN